MPTVKETFELLKSEGVTSNIGTVRRWIRDGKLKATMTNKKEGYWIEPTVLLDFLKTKVSTQRYEEMEKELFKTFSPTQLEFRRNIFRLWEIENRLYEISRNKEIAKEGEGAALKAEMRAVIKKLSETKELLLTDDKKRL